MKICNKCKAEKPATEFDKHKKCRDGLQPSCKSCVRYAAKMRRALDPEKYRSAANARYAANPEKFRDIARSIRVEKADTLKAQAAIRRAANPEKYRYQEKLRRAGKSEQINAAARAYREKNQDKARKSVRDYHKANPDKISAHKRNRRAREHVADGAHTSQDIMGIFTSQCGLCANCKTKLFKSGAKKYHVDHIMPLALGGSNWPHNLQCLCPPCNLSKGAKHPDAWAKQNGKLL